MLNSTHSLLTTTSEPPVTATDKLIGFLCLFVSSVFYGGNYLPVKHYETGDGMFFQLVVCVAIWSSGFVVHCIRGFPKFYMLPVLGGFFWSTGNANTVPVIKCLGIGLGSLFWNIVGLIVGWAYARFGWFGVHEEKPRDEMLNYLGVGFTVLSTFVFIFVKTETKKTNETQGLINSVDEQNIYSSINNEEESGEEKEASVFDRMSVRSKRVVGTLLSMFAGVMYAITYAPILYVQDNYTDASKNQNDYAFSLSTGIFIGSLFYFVIYCVVLKNKPKVYPQIIFPGFVSGWLWGIANSAYFIATDSLTQAITFPIVNIGPMVVAFMLGLFYREVKGRQNLTFLFLGSTLGAVGIVFCALSI